MTEDNEQRKSKREQTIFYLEVFDAEIDQCLGRVVDITSEGVMLIHERPLAINRVYQLKIMLPREISGSSQLHLKAECRWCRQSVNEQFFDAGLRITDISDENKLRIDIVLKYYSFPL
jgi:PilZ domain